MPKLSREFKKKLKDIQGDDKASRWRRVSQPGEALELLEQTKSIFDWKLQGYTHEQIADQLEISTETVRQRIYDELAVMERELESSKEVFRALELARLEALQTGIWDMALAGNLDAVDRMLKISERRARLLGLDKPTRIEIMDWRKEAEQFGLDPDELFEWVVGRLTDNLEGRTLQLLKGPKLEGEDFADVFVEGEFEVKDE